MHAVTWNVTPCNVVTSADFARKRVPCMFREKGAKIFCKQLRLVIVTTHQPVMRYTALDKNSMNWITSLCLCGIDTEGNGDMAIPPVYRRVYNDLPTRFRGKLSFVWQRAVKTT